MTQKPLERPVPDAVNALSDDDPADVLMRLWDEAEQQAKRAAQRASQVLARRQAASVEKTDSVRYAYD